MHEAALYRRLDGALRDVSRQEGGVPITRVRVWIGALAHVTEAQLRDAWPNLVVGGPAEGAELEVDRSADTADPNSTALVIRSVDVGRAPDAPPRREPTAARGGG
jgi:hydrogenase nickel incorporation protein HypA/HybF